MSEPEKPPQQSQLFRQEALEHHARPQAHGSLLQIQPFWARVTFWIIAILALTLGTGLALVEVNDYATGPVVMQVKGLEDVTVTSPGRVSQVFVTKGQYVRVGQPLLELHSNLEEVESQRMQQ